MATIGTIRYHNGSNWVDILHPVGSFYFSTDSTPPASLFGGTWVQITDAALRASDSIGYVGSDTHVQTVNEMPPHTHSLNEVLYIQDSTLTNATTANAPYWYVERLRSTGSTGGGASNVACPAFLQLLCLVQNCVDSLAVM